MTAVISSTDCVPVTALCAIESAVGTHTLCFLKFLLCYALIPNTKPIMLIVLYLLCSRFLLFFILACDNSFGNLYLYFTEKTSYSHTRLRYPLNIRKALCTRLITQLPYNLTLLCQHYAGITKPPIMPKAIASILCLSLAIASMHGAYL